MKMVKLFAFTLVLGAVFFFNAGRAHAQGGVAPSSQFGIGAGTPGFQLQYAITPGLHIGSYLGVEITSPAVGDGQTTLIIEPYGRFLLEGVVNPFVQAGLTIRSADATSTSLYAALGLEYFITRNVGVYGLFSLLEVPFEDGSTKVFGLGDGHVGVEWFFSP